MGIEVNWLAIVLAALSTLVIGSVWYAPQVFGKQWERLIHRPKGQKAPDAARAISIALVMALVTAYALAYLAFLTNQYFDRSFLTDSLATAFWVWLGLTAARVVTHDSFEGRPQRLTLLTMGHEFVTFMIMGLIIGLLAP
jgi:hypothetical protein